MRIPTLFTFENMKQHISDNVLITPLETACHLRGDKETVLKKLSCSTEWNCQRISAKTYGSTIRTTNIQVGWHYDSTKKIDGVFCCIHGESYIKAYKFNGDTCKSIYINEEEVKDKAPYQPSIKDVNNIFIEIMYNDKFALHKPSFKLVKSNFDQFGSKSSDVEHLKKFDTIREFFLGYEHYLSPAFQERLARQPDPVQLALVPAPEDQQVPAKNPPVPAKNPPVPAPKTPQVPPKNPQIPANNPPAPANNPPINNQQSARPDSNKRFYIGVALLAAFVVSGIFIKMKYFPSANSVKV